MKKLVSLLIGLLIFLGTISCSSESEIVSTRVVEVNSAETESTTTAGTPATTVSETVTSTTPVVNASDDSTTTASSSSTPVTPENASNANGSMGTMSITRCADIEIDLAFIQGPEGSKQDRCASRLSDLVFDFTSYQGTPDSIYADVYDAILGASEAFPIPDGATSQTIHLYVSIWHRETTNHLAVVKHRCGYIDSSSSGECERNLLTPMATQGQGMGVLSRDSALFEIVWPTLDDHEFAPTSHWIPASHEWIHVYQNAHVLNHEGPIPGFNEIDLKGPVWLYEGTADYLAALISDQFIPGNFASELEGWVTAAHEVFNEHDVPADNILLSCESPADQVESEITGDSWQCPIGRVAVAYLQHLSGSTSVEHFRSFNEELKDYGWLIAFERNFGRSYAQFQLEFAEFLEMQLDIKLAFIGQPSID